MTEDALGSLPDPASSDPASSQGARRRWLRRAALGIGILLLLLLAWGLLRYRVHEVVSASLSPVLRSGEVVLVRRRAYADASPARWDVVLLSGTDEDHPPRLQRVVALPGERLRILRGDLWVQSPDERTWRPLARPPALRDRLYVPVYPLVDVSLDPKGAFVCEAGWTVLGPGRLAYAGGTVARARFSDPITTTTRADVPTTLGTAVNDVRIGFQVTPGAEGDFEVRWRAPDGWEASLTLSTREADRSQGLRVTRPGAIGTQTWARGLRVGARTDVVFRAVDGEVAVLLGGELVCRMGIGLTHPPEEAAGEQELAFGARGGALEVTGIRIERDGVWDEVPSPVPSEGLLGRAEYLVLPLARRGRVP